MLDGPIDDVLFFFPFFLFAFLFHVSTQTKPAEY